MMFTEALKLLESRKFVARPAWKEEKRFIAILPDFQNIMQLQGGERANINLWPAKIEDYNADDWEEV